MSDGNFQERRRSLLREKVKDSRALEALLFKQGKQLEYERQRQATLDAEAELMEAESASKGSLEDGEPPSSEQYVGAVTGP